MTLTPFLDDERLAEHRHRNFLHSLALVGAMSVVVMVAMALVWSWQGALSGAFVVLVLALVGPRVQPEAVMRLYNATPIDEKGDIQLRRIVEVLADRAELDRHPRLYVVPSMTLNAFATGRPDHAAIAITEGLLRKLSLREIAGVIAHEMSHIRNNDLHVMAMADALTRLTQWLSYLGVLMAAINIPALYMDFHTFSWLAIGLLYLAPTISSLLQLGLSRVREFDADREAAGLTGDPGGLASALSSLERNQGRFWEDLMLPVPARRIPQPSVLRSHPDTAERISRLRELERQPAIARPMVFGNQPVFTLVGLSPSDMTPKYRLLGLWY